MQIGVELRHLMRRYNITIVVNHTAEMQLLNQRAQFIGQRRTVESNEHQLTDFLFEVKAGNWVIG
ncbi:MAG: hypothetical protein N2559_10500 [Anaerolineae bacterium]|nr:hypothetical protein [Anaerolineae bacterium]